MPDASPSSKHASEQSGEPVPKRRKIPLACNACRDRKSRCDGRRPACSTCEKKGTSDKCAYEESTLITQRYESPLSVLSQQCEILKRG